MTSQLLRDQDSTALEIWVRLLRGHAGLRRILSAQLQGDHGLTVNDFEALLLLSRADDGRLRRVDLADRLQLTPAGVTRLLDGLEEFGSPLAIQEVDLGAPQDGEVLVRLEACGICHTDMYTASGADPSGYAPTVLGHEGAGVVEAVGDGVKDLAVGDHVVTLFSPQCRECVHCVSPKTNICLAIRDEQGKGHLPDGTTRLSRDGEPIRHFMGTSTFAEYTVMPEIALAKVSPEAPLDRACLFACGLSTGLGAAMNTAKVEPGSTCVVFGAGMVGLGAVAGCRLQGAERILCFGLSEERLALARGQGATDAWPAGPDAVDRVLEATGGAGADYTFEATGRVDVMRQAV